MKKAKMVIFKLLLHPYMPTTLYVSFYQINSIALLYPVHKYKKKFKSTNRELTNLLIYDFSSFSSEGVWLFKKS